jgi:penicillin-binding protein 1A
MAKRRTPKSEQGRFARFLKWSGIAGGLAVLALLIAVGIAWSSLPNYESLKQSPNGQMIRVRAADGTVIVALGPSYGAWLKYRDIPPVMVDAMVSIEDRRYRWHPGVDPIGIARSLAVGFEKGRFTQGGSTITQQLARNIFLTNDRTWTRKLREIVLALALERKFSKNQVLELYLNRVYFGGGAYGIDAASRKFFGHPATELSLEEAAIIAGLVKAPSNYSPTADAKAAIGRSRVVLNSMVENGKISASRAASANPASVEIAPEANQNSVRYFTDWALPQLETLIDETIEPIDVWTTLDLKMQSAANAAIRANVPPGTQGALVALDRDGAVRAMVGGTDYVTSIYNRATQAVRQPGSAFKLFVYLAALESGMTTETNLVDEPIDIDGWSPRNSSGAYRGAMTLRTAFTYSVNTIAAKIGAEVGTSAVAGMAQRFGITTPVNTHPSMVLGTSDVRLIDMTRAYASVASKGIAIAPYGILKVTTDSGNVIYRHQADMSRVLIPPYVAAGMTDLLQTAVNAGTGRAAQIGRPTAGKTGTTSSNKDGWFLGFSSGITTGVWMGRDDARPVRGLQGGTAPARAFAQFMKSATAGRKIEPFDTEVTLPEWQLEPDEEAYFGEPDNGSFVDEDGNFVPRNEPGVDEDPIGAPLDEELPFDEPPPPPATTRRPETLIPGTPPPVRPVSGRTPATRPPPRATTPERPEDRLPVNR